MKPKRITDLQTLEIGKKYYVVCGIWSANTIYCGHVHSKRDFTFTFGKTAESWHDNFNIVAPKSKLKVYEEV